MSRQPPAKRKGATKGLLAHLTPRDPSVSEEDSRDGAILRSRVEPGGDLLPISGLKGVLRPPSKPVSIEAMRPRYSRDELLAQVDPTAPWPEDMLDWERAPPVGREFGAVRELPVSRARRELQSLLRRHETVRISKNGRTIALLTPTSGELDAEMP